MMKNKPTGQYMDVPFQGHYYMLEDNGTYHCKSCAAPLFSSEHKFHSGSGWPSFDQAIREAVKVKEPDGRGRKVYCVQCNEFLGLLIQGEGFTKADRRFDINSSAIQFKPKPLST